MPSIGVKSNIADVLANLRGVSKDVVDKAIPRALNRTAQMARTAASREMRNDGYMFTASEVKQAIDILRANAGSLTASLRVKRQTTNLMKFGARQTKEGVAVKVHKSRKVIKGAFIAQLRNGRYGVYIEDKTKGKTVLRQKPGARGKARTGWHDYPVRKLYGPSVGGAYSTEQIQVIMLRLIGTKFTERLIHEIQYLMGKG